MAEIKNAKTLSEAISSLENAGKTKADEIKSFLGSDFTEIKKTFADLKPYLDDLKVAVEKQVSESKSSVEEKITKNPWLTFAIVGFVAFILGCLITAKKKTDPPQ